MAQLYRVGNKPAGDGNGRWHCGRTVSDAPGLPLHCRYSVAGDFTATALLLVIGIAWRCSRWSFTCTGYVCRGVVLADNEYRHELETDIAPFKGLLLGLFFISVGASIDFNLLLQQPLILGLVIGLALVKFAVLFGLGRFFRLELSQSTFRLCLGSRVNLPLCYSPLPLKTMC